MCVCVFGGEGVSTQEDFEAEADLNSCEYRLQLRTIMQNVAGTECRVNLRDFFFGATGSALDCKKRQTALAPYKTTVVHNLCDTDRETRLNYVNWYFQGVHNEERYSTFFLFCRES